MSADGTKESATPVQFAGSIAAGTEVHVMSDGDCNELASCGWSGGLPLRGFAGDADGSKMFVTKFRMPIGDKTPAYWILPSQGGDTLTFARPVSEVATFVVIFSAPEREIAIRRLASDAFEFASS